MISEVQRYKKYHTVIRTLLLICGLWPKPDVSRAYQIFTVLLASSIIFTGTGTLFFVLNHRANLDLIIKGMAIGVSILSVLLKVIMFSYCRDVLGDIHMTLDAGFQKDFKDPVLQPILLSKIKYFYRPTMSLMYWTMSLATLYVLTPIISIIVQRKRNVPKLKLSTPWPTKFPWSYENNIVIYLLQYGSDLCTSVGLFSITCGTDALYGFYIFQMASQFNVLAYRMSNIKSFYDYQRVIKECHERSLMLEYCRNQFQKVFGPIVLWMVTTSAMVLCTNIFQAYQIGTYKAAAVVIHMVTKLIQTLIYGWYGSFLTNESEAFQQSIYNCGWNAYRDKTLWSNILTMSTMYKPLVIKACQMTVISLDTFTALRPDKAPKLLSHICTKLTQTLLYGFYGLILTVEFIFDEIVIFWFKSEGFQFSIYNSGWNGCGDQKFLTNILTMATYKPLVLKACSISVISLEMFTAILNTAISYFFLLQTIDEK